MIAAILLASILIIALAVAVGVGIFKITRPIDEAASRGFARRSHKSIVQTNGLLRKQNTEFREVLEEIAALKWSDNAVDAPNIAERVLSKNS